MAPTIPATGEKQALYYSGFTGEHLHPKYLPFQLVEPFSKEEALSTNDSYYIGHYNEKGQLHRIEKYFKDEKRLEYEYLYHGNGILREARTIYSGNKIAKRYRFDPDGEPVDKYIKSRKITPTGKKEKKYYRIAKSSHKSRLFPRVKGELLPEDVLAGVYSFYSVLYYDEKGKLYRIENFDKGKMKRAYEYYYYPDGKLKTKKYAGFGDTERIYMDSQSEEPPNDE